METRSPRQDESGAGFTPAAPLRCCCGSLLARLIPEGVEIKCRRCKRRVILPVETKGGAKTDM